MGMGLGLRNNMSLKRRSGSIPLPTTPVLTWTSDSATYDPSFHLTEIALNDVVELQIDDNLDFSSLHDSDTNTIDALEASDGEVTFPGISTIPAEASAKTWYARARYTRGGSTSPWSNIVSKLMDAAPDLPTQLVNGTGLTGAGVNRNRYIDSDGFTATMNGDLGDWCSVRCLDVPPIKSHFEVTITAAGGALVFGFVDAAVALGPALYPKPGLNCAGVAVIISSGARELYFDGGSGAYQTDGFAVGDVYSWDVDRTNPAAPVVVVKRNRGGTVTTYLGGIPLSSQIPTNWTAFVGGTDTPGSFTANFGGTAWAVTPLTDHVGW